jgi:hypothetical protein
VHKVFGASNVNKMLKVWLATFPATLFCTYQHPLSTCWEADEVNGWLWSRP